jgi:DNA-binding beta-propeller fold protein YncE
MDRRRFLAGAAAVPFALLLSRTRPSGAGVDNASEALSTGGGTWLALVTADAEAHVVALEPATGRVVGRIRTLAGPRSVESLRATWAVVAHTSLGRLSLLHAPTLGVRRVVAGFRAPRYTAMRPADDLAFVTDSALQRVVAVAIPSGRIVAQVAVPGPARHVSLSPEGDVLWTALGSTAERIAVVDVSEHRPRLARTIAPPFPAHDVVFAPDGEHVWVTSGSGHRLAVYERDGKRPVAVLGALGAPQHIAFAGRRALVASGADGVVRVHRLDCELVDEARVPVGSYNVSFADGSATAVTPSLSGGTVAVLDAAGVVRRVQRVAHAAHDACIVVSA